MTILMATFALQKRPRPYPMTAESHVRNYARRWWLVEAQTPGEARTLILQAEAPGLDEQTTALRVAARAKIKRCGGHRAETRPPRDYKRLAGFRAQKGWAP